MKSKIAVILVLVLILAIAPAAHAESLQKGDTVYFGEPDEALGFDGAWIVLEIYDDGILVVSENLLAGGTYFRNEKNPETNSYVGSDAQKWCAEFYETHFSESEKALILPVYKSDDAYAKKHSFGSFEATVNFDPAPEILSGDRVFLLSAEEADTLFPSDESRIAGYKGRAASWWLRSPHDPSFPIDVGTVFYNGWLLDFLENQNNVFGTGPVCMRPAMKLSTSASAEKVSEGKWRLSSDREYDYSAKPAPKAPNLALMYSVPLVILAAVIIAVIFIVKMARKKRQKHD